jgi:hypothetical protein
VNRSQEPRSKKQEAGEGTRRLRARFENWNLGFAICHLTFVIFPLLLLWRPLFAGEAFHWGTPLLQFVPWQRMAAEMWRSGHLPLWNSLVGCGAPLAANYQTAAFYPLGVFYLLLPAEIALSWTTALHLALAGWGMYRFGRAVELEWFPALIGALALEGSGFLVARLAVFPSMAFAFPWLAIWLWRGEMLVRRHRISDALWLGLTLGLGLLAGHAQTAFYGGVLLGAYLVFRSVQEARDRRQEAGSKGSGITYHVSRITLHAGRLLAPAALSLVVGVAIAAIQLLPTAELMLFSQRSGGVGYDFAMTYSMWPWRLVTFVAPGFFGNPGRGNYAGYATYWEDAGYVGLLPLLLAVGAVLALRRRDREGMPRRGATVFWLSAAVLALVLALGDNTPVFPFLFRYVPTFSLFQAPARWLAVTTVSLASLAAIGAHTWPAGRFRQRRGALGIVFGVAQLIAGLAAPHVASHQLLEAFGAATLRLGLGLIAVGVLILAWREKAVRQARGRAWWRMAVAVFVTLDLLLFGWPLVPSVDRSLYQGSTETSDILAQETGPVRVYWPTDPSHRNRRLDAESRVKFTYLSFGAFGPRDVDYWWEMREALLPNAGMLDGIPAVDNFEPLLVGWYADVLRVAMKAPDLVPVMGATHVASDEPWPGGEPIHAVGDVTLYRLPDALGRAWVVPSARQVASDDILTALSEPEFDPTAEVLMETPVSDPRSPVSSFQSLTLQDGANRVTIRVSLDAPGYLVLADTWYPGWRAMVDGRPAEILLANHAFRAVPLDRGEHVVEMVYRPASVLVGGVVSLVAVMALVAGLLLARCREGRE